MACALPSFGVFYNSDLGKFACYKHGDIVCQQIWSKGSWEMHHAKAFAPFTEPDFTFVDVGSNVGWYTFWMARSHKVVAFEPFASNLALQNATRCAHPDLAQHITLHPFGENAPEFSRLRRSADAHKESPCGSRLCVAAERVRAEERDELALGGVQSLHR